MALTARTQASRIGSSTASSRQVAPTVGRRNAVVVRAEVATAAPAEAPVTSSKGIETSMPAMKAALDIEAIKGILPHRCGAARSAALHLRADAPRPGAPSARPLAASLPDCVQTVLRQQPPRGHRHVCGALRARTVTDDAARTRSPRSSAPRAPRRNPRTPRIPGARTRTPRRRSYPFLLVDRVVEVVPQKYAIGYKNITVNDQFFNGHFPERAIMPGAAGEGGGGGERGARAAVGEGWREAGSALGWGGSRGGAASGLRCGRAGGRRPQRCTQARRRSGAVGVAWQRTCVRSYSRGAAAAAARGRGRRAHRHRRPTTTRNMRPARPAATAPLWCPCLPTAAQRLAPSLITHRRAADRGHGAAGRHRHAGPQ